MKKKYLISFVIVYLVTFLTFETTLANKDFFDAYGHWAEDAIIWGTNSVRLFNGYEDGTFKPDDSISRSEYISILNRVAKSQGVIFDNRRTLLLENDEDMINNEDILNYKDISSTFWAYNDIQEVAKFINDNNTELDFKKVFPNDKFEPNKNITREEATILSYFFTIPAVEGKNIHFSDIGDSYSYEEQIYQLANNGIIEGYADNTFRPNNRITRGEAATIIKRIYDDMEYTKTTFLNGIQLVEIPDRITYPYPLFGEYSSIILDENDLLYKKAIETFEYQSLVGTIPYEEKPLYDSNPVGTLNMLKELGYSNNIGLNYYLIEYDNLSSINEVELVNEMLKLYLNGANINDYETAIIFKKVISLGGDKELILQGLNNWYNIADDYVYKFNALYMISELYTYESQFEEAIKLYDVTVKQANLETQRMFFMNKAYIYLLDNKLYDAETVLREGWQVIKNNNQYCQNENENDKYFIGALKEVMIQKKIYQNN